MLRRLCVVLGIAGALCAHDARAQDVAVAVRVVDSTNSPVADADIAVVRDLSTALAHGTTNRAGLAQLHLARSSGTLQLIVRKIGFQPGYRFFTLTASDTAGIDILLARSVVAL